MRLLFILYFICINFVVILDAAKTTTLPSELFLLADSGKTTVNAGKGTTTTLKVEDVVQRGSELCNFHTCETTITPKVVDEEIIPIKGTKPVTTISPGKATTKAVIEENDASEPIKPGKATTAGKPPPDPPVDSVGTTKSGKPAAAETKTSEPITTVGKDTKITVASEIVRDSKATTVVVEDVAGVKGGKTTTAPNVVEDEEIIPIKVGKQTTTIKPGKAITKTVNEEEEETEPIKPGKATTIGKPPPDPPADLSVTTKSGKAGEAVTTTIKASATTEKPDKAAAAATTTVKGGKEVTTEKPSKAETIALSAVKTTVKAAAAATTTTTKAAVKTTTTTTRTTTTTTTPAPSNGFLTFIKDAANIRPTFSVCGYFCNILGIKTRKKRLSDYSSLLAGLNQRDANFKAINKADFKLAIERSNGLLSPAIAAIQSQDLS